MNTYGNLDCDSWADERPVEFLNGIPVSMAPAAAAHNIVGGNIFNLFRNYLKGKPCRVFTDNLLVKLTEKDHFIPNAMIVCDRNKIKGTYIDGAPDLVVEVLSHSTAKYDLTYKKDVYGWCGVREYWVVNPYDRTIQQYLPEGGELVLREIYVQYPDWELEGMSGEELDRVVTVFRCSLFDDLEIRVEDVFADML